MIVRVFFSFALVFIAGVAILPVSASAQTCSWVLTSTRHQPYCVLQPLVPDCSPASSGATDSGTFYPSDPCSGTYQCQCSAPPTPLPTVTCSASPNPVPGGTNTTVTWSSTNATSCDVQNYGTASDGTSGNISVNTVTAQADRSVSCTGPGGSASCSLLINAYSLTLPGSCTVAANASTCTVTASWYVRNAAAANRILVDGNTNNDLSDSTEGTGTVRVAYGGTTFKLTDGTGNVLTSQLVTADCASGSIWNESICVAIQPTITVWTSPSPAHIADKGSFTINMTSTNANYCTWTRTGTYGGWTSQPVPPATPPADPRGSTSLTVTGSGWAGLATVNYYFSCFNNNGAYADGSATVTIDAPPPPTVNVWFN